MMNITRKHALISAFTLCFTFVCSTNNTHIILENGLVGRGYRLDMNTRTYTWPVKAVYESNILAIVLGDENPTGQCLQGNICEGVMYVIDSLETDETLPPFEINTSFYGYARFQMPVVSYPNYLFRAPIFNTNSLSWSDKRFVVLGLSDSKDSKTDVSFGCKITEKYDGIVCGNMKNVEDQESFLMLKYNLILPAKQWFRLEYIISHEHATINLLNDSLYTLHSVTAHMPTERIKALAQYSFGSVSPYVGSVSAYVGGSGYALSDVVMSTVVPEAQDTKHSQILAEYTIKKAPDSINTDTSAGARVMQGMRMIFIMICVLGMFIDTIYY